MDPTFTTDAISSTAATDTLLTANPHHFHVADYIVLVLMLVISLAIGFYYAFWGGKQKTTAEYFKGNQNMSLFPIVFSLLASFLSSNSMLGIPAEVYHYGINYIFTIMGAFFGIPFAAYLFVPVFYDLKITSIFEYLQMRFNRTVRLCGSLLSVITLVIYAAFVTYGPALALSQVTGLSLWGSILTTTIIGTTYTSIGGIKAVIWTDTIQLVVFTVALLIVIVKGVIEAGGFGIILSRASEGLRMEPLSFSFDPRVRFTFWAFLIASTLSWTNAYGLSQIQLQRYLCCPTKRLAQRSVWLNMPGMMIVIAIYGFIGVMLYAAYWNCDPMSSQQIQQPDQIFPLYVMSIMQSLPGLPGLFVAGVYSASLSTISSVLNSLAAITLEDFVRPCMRNLSDLKATNISKIIALIYGGICLLMVAAITNLGSIVQASYYLLGSTSGGNFGIFTLALFIPWSNPKGSIIGLCFGLSISSWIALGNQINKPRTHALPVSIEACDSILGHWTPLQRTPRSDDVLEIYKISYFWVMPIAWIVTVVIGALASLCIGKNKENIDMALYSPVTRYVMRKFKLGSLRQKENMELSEKDKNSHYAENVTLPILPEDNSLKPKLVKKDDKWLT